MPEHKQQMKMTRTHLLKILLKILKILRGLAIKKYGALKYLLRRTDSFIDLECWDFLWTSDLLKF